MEELKGLLVLCLMVLFYFLPSIIATNKKHHNTPAIIILNLVFGWTVLGWFGALIWAYTKPAPK